MRLNDQQKKIVNTKGGKIAVLAGAGAGKTSTTIELVAKLYEVDKIPLARIFISTFTNKAGEDIKRKLQKRFGLRAEDLKPLWIGTFHSLSYRYLRDVKKLKLNIITPSETKTLIRNICESIKASDEALDLDDILSCIDKKRNKSCAWKEVSKNPEICKSIFEAYQKEKIKHNLVDFNDLLEKFAECLKEDLSFKNKFDWVMVDENQDQNLMQDVIADLLTVKNIVRIGDTKQSIYSFRGACPQIFKNRIKEADIVHSLSYNYRSSSKILDFANELLKQTPQFQGQELLATGATGEKPIFFMCNNQAFTIYNQIINDIKNGIPLHEIAVLSRSVKYASIGELELLLRKDRIPYEVRGGLDKLDISYVQDFLAILKTLSNPNTVSLLNTFSLLPQVGPKIAKELTGVTLEHGFNQLKYAKAKYSQTKAFQDFLKLKEFKGKNTEIISEAMNFYYEHCLKPLYKDAAGEKKKITMDLLFNTLSEYEDLSEGIDQLYINKDSDEGEKSKNKIIISTLHQSKGLEFQSVHIAQCIEFSLPFLKLEDEKNQERLEEEFCLFYVGCTRAKSYLKMYMPYRTQRGQNSYDNKLSRYIRNIYQTTREQFFTLRCLDVPNEERLKEGMYRKITMGG